jgi:arylsulfatase
MASGVLLIAVDGLRADHLGAYGYDRETSPLLGQLASAGVRFEEVFASAPVLIPAHAALLTGCDPSLARRFLAPEFEGLSERRWRVSERVPHLAVEFLAAGYATAAFVEHELLAESFGFARGFQRYELLDPSTAEHWEGPQDTRVIEHFLQWLRRLPASHPWFAYLHLHELERSWSAPTPSSEGYFQPRPELAQVPPVASTDAAFFAVPRTRWRGGARTLGQYEAAYDDQIRRLDGKLERLCASLRHAGRFEATTLHVLGSFGLQFGEAGMILASGRYSRADLGVPWIVRPRAGLDAARGRSVPGLVSTLDVAPTVLALEGLAVPPGTHGLSQADAVRRSDGTVAERSFVFASCGLQEGCAVIGEHHVLEYLAPLGTADAQLRRSWSGAWSERGMQPSLYFYDRRRTPYPPLTEWRAGHDAELAPYRAAALEWLRDMNQLRQLLHAPPGASGLDEAALERLRERGYAGAGAAR